MNYKAMQIHNTENDISIQKARITLQWKGNVWGIEIKYLVGEKKVLSGNNTMHAELVNLNEEENGFVCLGRETVL